MLEDLWRIVNKKCRGSIANPGRPYHDSRSRASAIPCRLSIMVDSAMLDQAHQHTSSTCCATKQLSVGSIITHYLRPAFFALRPGSLVAIGRNDILSFITTSPNPTRKRRSWPKNLGPSPRHTWVAIPTICIFDNVTKKKPWSPRVLPKAVIKLTSSG